MSRRAAIGSASMCSTSLAGKGSAAIFRSLSRLDNGSMWSAWPMRRRPRATRTECSRTATATPGPAPVLAATIHPACGSRHSVGSSRFELERVIARAFPRCHTRGQDLEPCTDGTGGRQPAWRRSISEWPRGRVPAELGHCPGHCSTAQWSHRRRHLDAWLRVRLKTGVTTQPRERWTFVMAMRSRSTRAE